MDPLLSLYVQSRPFSGYTVETKRNYTTDIALLLTALWSRGKTWLEATSKDLENYEDWRRFASANPDRIGGSKWDRELSAIMSLYSWAKKAGYLTRNPVLMKQVLGRNGESLLVPEQRADDARPSNVHWLTPRTWRRWIDVGLRGHTREGAPEPGWVGRLEDRNVAFARTLVSSGLRLGEGSSLLTFEVPKRRLGGGRYYRGQVAAEVTRSKKQRTYYVSSEAIGDVESYVASSRAWAVRKAQKAGRYDRLPEMRMLLEVTRGLKPKVRWCDRNGVIGERELNLLTWQERTLLFEDRSNGPEPLWLWLNERGLPFEPSSWESVFRTANERCERVLTPPEHLRKDPHQVFAPYATPHAARHSFALFMLVVLNHLLDQRYGLTPEERRDFRLLYGDPWFMVQNLLGHASRDTTVKHYLAPVADLQLRAMLATAEDRIEAPMPELDAVFARIARESEGIQDIDDRMQPATGGAA
ncbi:site-specific integrase [Streptomyces sp. NBC_01304]|uniref:site-specific integrase n=1 Tax=Streptomyces sp. NBC_01304 TaxID=2903818 RepID=UPI002E104295|nr:site-specific integrase [Streptomyces sp. NBC_01304]WSJ89676.1 site-specific integrase [Streptomyces sp. NBC_01304]